MAKFHWSKFCWNDWTTDPDLRRCSKAAKGFWMDALAIAFQCDERGVFITNGRPWTLEEIANAIPGDPTENLALLNELVDKNVARRRNDGAVFNKRMYDEWRISNSRADAGRAGGSKTQANHQAKLKQTLSDSESDSSEGGCKGETHDPLLELQRAGVRLPTPLDTPAFCAEYAAWLEHCAHIGVPEPSPIQVNHQLARLSKMGASRAIAAIHYSMAQGYKGIFEPSDAPGSSPSPKVPTGLAPAALRAKERLANG